MKYAKKMMLVPFTPTPHGTNSNDLKNIMSGSLNYEQLPPSEKNKLYKKSLSRLREIVNKEDNNNDLKNLLNEISKSNNPIESFNENEDFEKTLSEAEKEDAQQNAGRQIKDYSSSNTIRNYRKKEIQTIN